MITKDPVYETEGYIDVTVGDYNLFSAQAAFNTPLGDKAAGRIALSYRSHDGWMKNAIGPDQLLDDTFAARGKLLLEPTMQLDILLQAEYMTTDLDAAGGGFATGGFPDADGQGQFRPTGETDTGYIDADGSPFTGEFDFPGLFTRDYSMVFADIGYELNDSVSLTSITSFSTLDSNYEEDNDVSPFDVAIFRQNTEQDEFTQELRLDIDNDRSRYTLGAYYLNIDGEYFQGYQINNVGNFNQVLAPIDALLLPLGQYQFADYSLETNSWSLFGQAEFDLTDQLTLTGGVRYTNDDKEYAYLNSCVNLLATPACPPAFDPAILAGAGLVTDSSDESGVSARLQMDYAVSDDWLLFASYNRGYKAFNYNAGFAGAALVEELKFDGETLNAYEIGSKLDFADGRARFNVSAFYYDYEDYQAFDQRGTSFILRNTDATLYGADAEFTVRPGNGFQFSSGVSLVETEVEDVPINGILTEREAAQAPELTFNFAASQEFAAGDGIIKLGVDTSYTAEYFSQLNNAPVTAVGDHWLVNARIGYTPPSERWEASIFVRNLLDEERLQYAFDITVPGVGLVEQVYGAPQWIGAQLRVNF